ncbi:MULTISPECIES: hypothetical protein [Pseudomonas]|uniref:hypothetical protein n=1 Tax=Pseudomonas TaxID=286 RepID=UPI0028A2D07F|nr:MULTISPECIES: hypothetical protein [Pseudomonas]
MSTPDDKNEFSSRQYPIQEDLCVQKRIWMIERIGWYLLCAIVILTLLGLFSKGPLSHTEIQSPDGELIIVYERFARNGASMPVTIKAKAGADGKATILLDGSLLDSFSVDSLQPEPVESRSYGSGMRLTYLADDRGWVQTHLSLRAQGVGLSRSVVSTLTSGPALQLTQFIYP